MYCCFTRTLFTTMIIVVCSLKRMCIPCFVSIGRCVHNVTFLFHGHYGYLSVHKVSFLNSVQLLKYAS